MVLVIHELRMICPQLLITMKKPTAIAIGLRSPGRARTYNNPVNSRVLCH